MSALTEQFDWAHPNYTAIFQERLERLADIRKDTSVIPLLKRYYKDNPWQFITDWGATFDPRNVEIGQPAVIPFILFPRQIDWIKWVIDSWHNRRPGVTPKSRESGVSWLAVGLADTMCLLYEGMAIGFGSRKEEYVDKIGAPKSLFWKAREFLKYLPPEFRGSWNENTDAPHMRIQFPDTNSFIAGEAGNNIGRGDRAAMYFVDEAAFLEQPQIVEAALSQTTNCRIDVSTANGLGNPFHTKVTTWPSERVFRFHWTDDPRKNQAWYDKQKSELDPVTIAQEIDIDFAASVEGVLIPSAWVMSALDANLKLGVHPSGPKTGALDVADQGRDKNAFCSAHGFQLLDIDEWSGTGDDIFKTTQTSFSKCDEFDLESFDYDADGVGAAVRGDARVINEERVRLGRKPLLVNAYRGSEGVVDPEKEDVKGRKNKDYFLNRKAQTGWALRNRFLATHRAVTEHATVSSDEIISIPSKHKMTGKLMMELSQPTYNTNAIGKMFIDKAPEATLSPNLYDCVAIKFAPKRRGLIISDKTLQRSQGLRR